VQGGRVADTDGTKYDGSLVLMPLKSATGDWFSDHTTIAESSATLGNALTKTYASIEAAAALANGAGFGGRSRHQMPHCSKHGIICNAMGRVVYYSVTGAKNVTVGTEKSAKIPGVDTVVLDLMQLPWLVNVHLENSDVMGRLPDVRELEALPAMVRFLSSNCMLHVNERLRIFSRMLAAFAAQKKCEISLQIPWDIRLRIRIKPRIKKLRIKANKDTSLRI
jgi:hypothetical protein